MDVFPEPATAFSSSLLSDESPSNDQELRAAHQVLRLLMSHIPDMIFWKDRNSVYLGCNEVFCANAGLQHPSEIVGLTDWDLPWATTEGEEYTDLDQMVMTTGVPELNIQERQLTASGRRVWLETNKIPLRSPDGHVVGVLGTAEDITARKEAEIQLQRSLEALDQRVRDRTHELEQQRRHADVLREIAAQVAGSLDLAEVFDAVLAGVGTLFPDDLVAVLEFSRRGLIVQSCFAPDPRRVRSSFEEGTKIADSVQAGLDAPWFGATSSSRMALSMNIAGASFGTLVVESERADCFGVEERQRLAVVADLAATAISNARSHRAAQELAAVQERQRIAHDLHDAVAQTLWTSSLIAQTMVDDPASNTASNLLKLKTLNTGALAEMRILLFELRPEAIASASLEDLLRSLATSAASRFHAHVTFDVTPIPLLALETKTALYRIAQEALNNITKHAEASTVAIGLRAENDVVTLTVSDDGCGFGGPGDRGHGVTIMHERASAAGALLEISSSATDGTTVTVSTRPNGEAM